MPRMNRLRSFHGSVWITVLAWTIAMLLPIPAFARPFKFAGIVVKVHDGDTISVVFRGHAEKVRLAGIDCPELRQAFGQRAKNFTTRLASGQMVAVHVQGTDDYDRKLGVVILPDGRSLNRELVKAGFAWQAKASKNKPVAQLERDARRAKRGLWAETKPMPPWEYRKIINARR
jgi:endonuclease YncB( thermonuclease family)